MTKNIPLPLDCSCVKRTFTDNSRPVPSPTSEASRSPSVCTDRMILARWIYTSGWDSSILKPCGPLQIPPTASILHYAIECFEGLKLYRGYDDGLRLFRPAKNCERMKTCAARVTLPGFDPRELEKMIVTLFRCVLQVSSVRSSLHFKTNIFASISPEPRPPGKGCASTLHQLWLSIFVAQTLRSWKSAFTGLQTNHFIIVTKTTLALQDLQDQSASSALAL